MIAKERANWSSLIEVMKEKIMQLSKTSEWDSMTATKFLEDFADEHGISTSSTKFYYYKEVRPFIDKLKDGEEQMMASEFKREYSVGDIIEVEATNIQDYGVFVKTEDGTGGLIHISEIENSYVVMPQDYFEIGEVFKVKVIALDKGGRLGLSTKALGGKRKVNKIKDVASVVVNNVEPIKSIQAIETQEKNKDIENIIEFIKSYSDNKISNTALSDIEELVRAHGVFKTTLTLLEVVREIDLSNYITSSAKDKLSSECLRVSQRKV
jgi:predicted RNA-binding protein with RPS1 domain